LPDGIVVDAEAGHIYWTNMGIPSLDDGSIERADIDGKSRKVIVSAGNTHTPKQIILVFVEMEMKASGFPDTGCDLKNPDSALMAEAMGVRGIRVEKPQELKGAIEAALAHKGPVLLDVLRARQELAMPPRTTLDQSYHFGMFMMKAVLDGRATQLLDLARVIFSADCGQPRRAGFLARSLPKLRRHFALSWA
jgi:hypothetical protein